MERAGNDDRTPILIIGEDDPQILEAGYRVAVSMREHPLRPHAGIRQRAFAVTEDQDQPDFFRIREIDGETGEELENGLEFKRRKDKPVTPSTFAHADIVEGLHHPGLVALGAALAIAAGGATYLRIRKARGANKDT